MAQSGPGIVRVFEDFVGAEVAIANAVAVGTTAGGCGVYNIGALKLTGDLADTDAGAPSLAGGLSGVVSLTGTNEDGEGITIGTETCLDVALMSPIVFEVRVQMDALTARTVYMGLCEDHDDAQDEPLAAATETLDYSNSSHLCGFYYDSQLTTDIEWHAVYKGGTAAAVTTSTSLNLGVTPVAGEWDVLKLVAHSDGKAEWYINGDLVKTLAGAVSTTADLAAICGVYATTTTATRLDMDYFLLEANRDWTR